VKKDVVGGGLEALDHSCGIDGKKVLLFTTAFLAFYIRRDTPALETRKEGGLIEILWASSSAAFCEAAVLLSAWWAYLMLRKIIAVTDERDVVIIQTPRKVSNHNAKHLMNRNTPIPVSSL
jgi:hypothetical protein